MLIVYYPLHNGDEASTSTVSPVMRHTNN